MNAQTELPSYRERIVTIRLTENQGGLNVNMPPDVVGQIAALGEKAGRLLVYDYAPPPVPDGLPGPAVPGAPRCRRRSSSTTTTGGSGSGCRSPTWSASSSRFARLSGTTV